MLDERQTTVSELERLRSRIRGFEQEMETQIGRVRTYIVGRKEQLAEEQRIHHLLRPQLDDMRRQAERLEAFIQTMDDAFPSRRS